MEDKHEKGDRTLFGLDHYPLIADFEFTMHQLIFNKNDEKTLRELGSQLKEQVPLPHRGILLDILI